jgi:hypothetical protein
LLLLRSSLGSWECLIVGEPGSTVHHHKSTDRRLPMSDLHSDADIYNGPLRSRSAPGSRRSKSRPLPRSGGLGLHAETTLGHRSGPLPDFLATRTPNSRSPTPAHMRRLYWSLGGRLETTRAQFDALHYFLNINVPIPASRARQVIDIRTVQAFNQKG